MHPFLKCVALPFVFLGVLSSSEYLTAQESSEIDELVASFFSALERDEDAAFDEIGLRLRELGVAAVPSITRQLAHTENDAVIYNVLSFLDGFDDHTIVLNATRELLERKPIDKSGPAYAMRVSEVVAKHGSPDDAKYFLPTLKMTGAKSYTHKANALRVLGKLGNEQAIAEIDAMLQSDAALVPGYEQQQEELVQLATKTKEAIEKRLTRSAEIRPDRRPTTTPPSQTPSPPRTERKPHR